jgi:hypothetical protein
MSRAESIDTRVLEHPMLLPDAPVPGMHEDWAATPACKMTDGQLLCLLILRRAVADYAGCFESDLAPIVRAKIREETIDWFRSRDTRPQSFRWACSALGLDPSWTWVQVQARFGQQGSMPGKTAMCRGRTVSPPRRKAAAA